MNPLIQEEKTGCGVTSVAAIVGVSYPLAQTAAASLGILASDPRLGLILITCVACLRSSTGQPHPPKCHLPRGRAANPPLLAINGISEEQD